MTPPGLPELLSILLDKNAESRFQQATALSAVPLEYNDYLGLNPKKSPTAKTDSIEDSKTNNDDSVSIVDDNCGETASVSSPADTTSPADTANREAPVLFKKEYRAPSYDVIRLNPLFDFILTSPANSIVETNNPVGGAISGNQDKSERYNRLRFNPTNSGTGEQMDWLTAMHLTTSPSSRRFHRLSSDAGDNTSQAVSALSEDQRRKIQALRNIDKQSPIVVPKLSELCVKGIAEACVILSDATSLAGGTRPNIPWMQVRVATWQCNIVMHTTVTHGCFTYLFCIQNFSLLKISDYNRHKLMHYLTRHERLHNSNLYRLFHSSAVNARCIRADVHTREYIGYTQSNQGLFESDFVFALFADPLITSPAAAESGSTNHMSNNGAEAERLKYAVSAVNKLRPRTMARVLDTIPVLFTPGFRDVGGSHISRATLAEKRKQDSWLEEEIQQAKLAANHVAVFSYHSWLPPATAATEQVERY
ncbi:unnamed protein product [Sphagnum balticum]